ATTTATATSRFRSGRCAAGFMVCRGSSPCAAASTASFPGCGHCAGSRHLAHPAHDHAIQPKEHANMPTQTATTPGADQTVEKKIQRLRELYADSPVGKTALENSIPALR